jgi:hypothetical protein
MTPIDAGCSTRVLLALESTAASMASMASIEVALRLAVAMQAEVAGVFVEDADLMRLAALPFTQETGFVSGAQRPLVPADVESTLRRRAEQARRSLADLASASRVRWSFRITRGKLLVEVLAAVDRDDVVVAGEGRLAQLRVSGVTERGGGTVAALFDEGDTGDRVLAAALSLAQGQPQRICLLVPPARAAATEALRLRAARSMQVAVEVPRIATLQSRRAAELIRETRRQASRALVLSPGSLPDAGEQVRVLLEQMSCPIVLTL